MKGLYFFIWFSLQIHYFVSRGSGALEAGEPLTVKYAFSHFSWYFFFKNLTSIYVGRLQIIYFNIKDSGHFDKFVL